MNVAAAPSASITLRGLSKHFGEVCAVDGIDIEIPGGTFLTLLGPSGCGKTTLLRLIAGLEMPTGGSVEIGGRDVTRVPTQKRGIGFAFQRHALFPHLTVRENISFGLRVGGMSADERGRRADELIELVRLEGLGSRLPGELSGGQAQRVSLARALAPSPDVLLLDEPLSALDLAVRVEMQEELRRLQRTLGSTFVCVTHDQGEALRMSDRVALMKDGRIDQEDTPAGLYASPKTLFAATFIGESNAWPVEAPDNGDRQDLCRVRLVDSEVAFEGRAPAGGEGSGFVYVVRPEEVAVGDESSATEADQTVAAVIEDLLVQGEAATLVARIKAGPVVRARVATRTVALFELGSEVQVSWRSDRAAVYRSNDPAPSPATPSLTDRNDEP